MTRLAAIAVGLSGLIGVQAFAAELPSRREPPPSKTQAERTCEIDGEPGVALANGGCLRVSGYVHVGVGAGNPKAP